MSASDLLAQRIEAAQPASDRFDQQLVRSQVMAKLFSKKVEAPSVGRFRLSKRLGAGGQGVVYSAFDPDLGRDVAVKLVRVHTESEREATLAEARALAKLSHPNVVAIYDVGVVDAQVYIVMEFVGGTTLRAYARQEGRSYREVLAAYRQAAHGLGAAHRCGLVHRDFKPDNAVIDKEARVRVIDFGLAIPHDSDAARGGGTPGYSAPEQSQGDAVGAAADQYALCLSLREAVEKTSDGDRAGWLVSIFERGCQERPSERYSDMDALLVALGRDPRILWKRRAIGFIGLSAVAAAFFVGATLFGSDSNVAACDGGADVLEAAWPEAKRSATQAHIARLGNYGGLVASRLTEGTLEFRTAWSRAHQSICLEHQRGESSAVLLDAKMQCLRTQRHAFATLDDVASDSLGDELAGIVLALNALPSPATCDALQAITDAETVPENLSEPIRAIEERLAKARVTIAAGNYDDAAKATSALEAEARVLSHPQTLAAVLLLKGRLAIVQSATAEASKQLTEAVDLALSSGKDAEAVEAWARRAWVDGMTSATTDALAGVDIMRAIAKRVGTESFSSALLHNNIGSIRIAQGKPAEARAELQRAVEIARRIEGPNALELVNTRGNLAIVTKDATARDALAAESVAQLTKLVGAEHPHTLTAAFNQGRLRLIPSEARSIVEPTCALLTEFHPTLKTTIALCYLELGWLAAQEQDEQGTYEAMHSAFLFGGTTSPAKGLAELMEGNVAQALTTLEELQTATTAGEDAPWWVVFRAAEATMALGHAYVVSGDSRGPTLLKTSLAALESIDAPVPTVLRRIALVRVWLPGD